MWPMENLMHANKKFRNTVSIPVKIYFSATNLIKKAYKNVNFFVHLIYLIYNLAIFIFQPFSIPILMKKIISISC